MLGRWTRRAPAGVAELPSPACSNRARAVGAANASRCASSRDTPGVRGWSNRADRPIYGPPWIGSVMPRLLLIALALLTSLGAPAMALESAPAVSARDTVSLVSDTD